MRYIRGDQAPKPMRFISYNSIQIFFSIVYYPIVQHSNVRCFLKQFCCRIAVDPSAGTASSTDSSRIFLDLLREKEEIGGRWGLGFDRGESSIYPDVFHTNPVDPLPFWKMLHKLCTLQVQLGEVEMVDVGSICRPCPLIRHYVDVHDLTECA